MQADVPIGRPAPSRFSAVCVWPSGAIGYRPFLRRGPSPSRSGHSRRLPPSRSPRRPEVLHSCGLLSPPSLLLRPHVSVSRPPANFPGALVISRASRARDLPRFDHPSFECCRHPYAGRPVACIFPTSSATALAIVYIRETWHPHSHRGAEHSVTGTLSGPFLRRCSIDVMLRPHPSQASWATDLGFRRASETCTSGQRLASHLLQDAGQRYRDKLGDSPGRTHTDRMHGVTGCT